MKSAAHLTAALALSALSGCYVVPGLDAQRQALEHGAQVSGVTVHLVNA
jgi:folate-dependent phosphoribosylglycinamide formyltransferase PurN